MRAKKRCDSGSSYCCASAMFAPASNRKVETAATMPGRFGQESVRTCWIAGMARRSGRRRLGLAQVGLDQPLQLHRDRLAAAVDRFADGQPHPAFADAVFLDIGLLDSLEADADATGEQLLVVEGAGRI